LRRAQLLLRSGGANGNPETPHFLHSRAALHNLYMRKEMSPQEWGLFPSVGQKPGFGLWRTLGRLLWVVLDRHYFSRDQRIPGGRPLE